MKKNVVQDVIPPKRSIRNIELPSKAKRLKIETEENTYKKTPPTQRVEEFTSQPTVKTPPPPPKYEYEYTEPPRGSRKWLYVSIVIFVLAASFGISALFKSADIKVTPRQESKTLSGSFVAKKDSTKNELGYQVVTVSKEATKTVSAESEEKAEKKARGTITIYNNAGTASQKLVATTRFQTPEGLIFRLVEPITVPGQTTKAGKTVAGSIDAVVEADAPGTSYNIGLKDFTIPGFKGDPKYTTVYARSKTEMSGGFSGMQKTASKESIASANTELEANLRQSLSKDLTSQIPANFVLYSTSISYTFEPTTQVDSSNDGAVLRKKGSITGIIFDKGILSRAILSKVAPELTNDMTKITNLDTLDFSYASNTPANPSTATTVGFTLKGTADVVWVFDENKLKSDLLGLSKKDAKTVIGNYPAIKEAWVETRPFWNQTIPTNPEKVTFTNTITP